MPVLKVYGHELAQKEYAVDIKLGSLDLPQDLAFQDFNVLIIILFKCVKVVLSVLD
jgi:hypothetical protein